LIGALLERRSKQENLSVWSSVASDDPFTKFLAAVFAELFEGIFFFLSEHVLSAPGPKERCASAC
jgi:hypothetical protein